jgi:2-polyprenyl-3-methyl-5-hydroxy-6-metoxy-1,4-benzoquinol methylase
MSAADLERLEAEIHDAEYGEGAEERIDIDRWWHVHDHCYKRGTYFRGYRKRRLMQMIRLPEIGGKHVLEVGCGRGELSVFMALHGAKVTSVDLSEVGINSAKRLATINGVEDRCRFDVQSASRLSFDDATFDLVVYNAVLHHALKYPNVPEETLRVLKPGGMCAFAEGIRGNPIYRAARSLKRLLSPTEVKGDVDIDVADLRTFSEGFSDLRMEFLCLTLGCKQLIARRYNNDIVRRSLFFCLSYLDRGLLAAFPALRPYCSEVVGTMRKPVV